MNYTILALKHPWLTWDSADSPEETRCFQTAWESQPFQEGISVFHGLSDPKLRGALVKLTERSSIADDVQLKCLICGFTGSTHWVRRCFKQKS